MIYLLSDGRMREIKKFRFLNIAIDETDIDVYINGEIVSDDTAEWYRYWGIGEELFASPSEFGRLLSDNAGKNLTVHINSGGGDFFAGVAMYNAIKGFKGNTTAVIDGLAASAATLPMVACKAVRMSAPSVIMIHCASMWTVGNEQELRHDIEVLETIDSAIANAYELKTELSHDKILELMRKETWMDAKEAKRLGFVDEVPFELLQDVISNLVASHKAVYASLRTKVQPQPNEQRVIKVQETRCGTNQLDRDFEYIKLINQYRAIKTI